MKIWIIAGETSGDARASELMQAMLAQNPDVRFVGAGGSSMARLASEPFDEWTAQAAVLGLWDVLRHYGYFRKKFHETLAGIERERPEAVILVDYPGFNLRLAAALRKRGFAGKVIYYISPQVWAWHRSRIPKMAKILDLMICIFPFEKPMFEASGLKTVFCGHPMLEALNKWKVESGKWKVAGVESDGQFENAPANFQLSTFNFQLERDLDLLGLFPGSRKREVTRNMPAMLAAARIVAEQRPTTHFAIAAANEEHAQLIREMSRDFYPTSDTRHPTLEVSAGNSRDLMRRAAAGIVCSGTATLEAAFLGLPYCLIYKTAWLTFEIGRRLVDVDCLGIVNILNNYRVNPPPDPHLPARGAPHVVREFIQHFATPQALAKESLRLLQSEQAQRDLRLQFDGILSDLKIEGASERAAEAVLREIPDLSERFAEATNQA